MLTAIAIAFDHAGARFHPIVFRDAPFPSGGDRYKSKGHHTEGFESMEDAQQESQNIAANIGYPLEMRTEQAMEVDGDFVMSLMPAMLPPVLEMSG